jgi:hypothetical protein
MLPEFARLIDEPHPFLTLHRVEDRCYLRYWYDRDEEVDQWFTVEVDEATVVALVDQQIGLNEAGLQGKRAWTHQSPSEVVDNGGDPGLSFDNEVVDKSTWTEYLPSDGLLSDEDVQDDPLRRSC